MVLILNKINAQDLNKVNFISPVKYKYKLSANFGEIRSGHFHSGIDIKTGGKIGKKVYAVSDGYVSRIKVSSSGYGKAIYITHFNGYTTVYGHLNKFEEKIDQFVKSYQYQKKTYEFNLLLKPNQFKIKQGDLIAYSGNTGSSGGPHIHFEVRDTKTEQPINPLLFDAFKLADDRSPHVYSLYIYPIDFKSRINNKFKKQSFATIKKYNNFRLKTKQLPTVSGNIGFGIKANDFFPNSWNKCGIYTMELFVDGKSIYSFKIDKLSFSTTRYINSHMDYEEYIKNKKKVHKAFIQPNNKLDIYGNILNKGIYNFNDNKIHTIKIVVTDVSHNKSYLTFRVRSRDNSNVKNLTPQYTKLMPFDKENIFKNEDILVKIPSNYLYDTIYFNYSEATNRKYFSKIFNIHKETMPVHKYYTIALKPQKLPKQLKDKALIAKLDKKNKLRSYGGVFIDSLLYTKANVFGKFVIAVDTVAPTIKPKTRYNNLKLSHLKKIEFKIKDDLSGIKKYNAYLDGQWVLLEYDAKNDKMFYKFPKLEYNETKRREFKIVVEDSCNNISVFKTKFYR